MLVFDIETNGLDCTEIDYSGMGIKILYSLNEIEIDEKDPYDLTGFATGSFKNAEYEIGTELIGEASHSDFATYVTTIGLYNNSNELMAIGKTAKPIKNDKEMALSFIVRFDTN